MKSAEPTTTGPPCALAEPDWDGWGELASLKGQEVGGVEPLVVPVGADGQIPTYQSVVVTRTRSQASQLRALLEGLGADVVEAPVLEIRHDAAELTTDERVTSRWDWIVFSSQNGADAFFAALRAAGRDARSLGSTQVAAGML